MSTLNSIVIQIFHLLFADAYNQRPKASTKHRLFCIMVLIKLGFCNIYTVKLLKILTPEIFAVIILKFEQGVFTVRVMRPKDAEGIANSVDPDQTAV